MAKFRLVSRLSLATVAISILNMVFSGGCTSPGSSSHGQDRFETAVGVSRDYPGEDASGLFQESGGYEDLSEWNFNSRMDRRSSANKNSSVRNVNPANDIEEVYSAQGENMLVPEQVNGSPAVRTYKYHNPSDPKADEDGFVTFTVPESSSFNQVQPVVQSQPSTKFDNINNELSSSQGQPLYYNTANNTPAITPGYSSGNFSQSQYPVQQNNNVYQQQPVIQPGRITGITVNGVNNNSSYSPLQSSIPQVGYSESQHQNSFTISEGTGRQVVAQKPVAYESGYALPRINEGSNQSNTPAISSSSIPVTYNNFGSPSTADSRSMLGNNIPNVNQVNNAVPALSQYNVAPQVSSVDDLTGNLEKLLSKDPDNLDLQMALRYAYAARGDYDRALQELSVIPIESQRKSIALARATILSSKLESTNDPMTANSALSALKILQDKVAGKADLKISTFKICSKVDNFGQYQEIAPGALESGNACEVLVYCELENYQYQLNDEGKYFTSLHAEITLFDSSLNVLSQISEDVVDTPSLNKRKDFFLRGPFKLPQLRPGKYQIVVSMEDKIAGKRALAARYPFEVKGSAITAGTSNSIVTQ